MWRPDASHIPVKGLRSSPRTSDLHPAVISEWMQTCHSLQHGATGERPAPQSWGLNFISTSRVSDISESLSTESLVLLPKGPDHWTHWGLTGHEWCTVGKGEIEPEFRSPNSVNGYPLVKWTTEMRWGDVPGAPESCEKLWIAEMVRKMPINVYFISLNPKHAVSCSYKI